MRALWIIFKRTRGILLTSTAVSIPTFCQLTSSNQGHLIGIQGNHSNFSTRSRHNIKQIPRAHYTIACISREAGVPVVRRARWAPPQYVHSTMPSLQQPLRLRITNHGPIIDSDELTPRAH